MCIQVAHTMSTVQDRKTQKQQEADAKAKEREIQKKEKQAHNLRLLEAKARIFPQFVADYYDAKQGEDEQCIRDAWKVCRDVYRELQLLGFECREAYKFCELAIRQTDAYLRQRFPKSTDLKHRTRLAKLLRRVDGPSWKNIACVYRGVNYHRDIPSEEEIISWSGLVGFPDPK